MSHRRDPDVAIRCVDLSVARASGRSAESLRVVDGVSFVLPHAASLAVMGSTGSGKSSLAAILAGVDEMGLAVVGGEAFVEGIPVRRPGRARRALTWVTGYFPQQAGADLPARMTVSEVIAEPIVSRDRRVNAHALEVRVATLLDELQLPLGASAKYPYELSAGMRQRVALARTFIHSPRVLIADEPFANLDVEARRAVCAAITRRRDHEGMSTLVVTNDTQVASDLGAGVLVLRAGRSIAYGSNPGDLLWTPSADADRRLVAS